jgi:hypothetical protein
MAGTILFTIIVIFMAGGIICSKKVIEESDRDKRLIKSLISTGFFIGAIMFSLIYGAATERQAQKIKAQKIAPKQVVISTEKAPPATNPGKIK